MCGGGVLLNLKQSQSDGNCSHSSQCSAQTKLSVRRAHVDRIKNDDGSGVSVV